METESQPTELKPFSATLLVVGTKRVMVGNRNSLFGVWLDTENATIGEAQVGEKIVVMLPPDVAATHQLVPYVAPE